MPSAACELGNVEFKASMSGSDYFLSFNNNNGKSAVYVHKYIVSLGSKAFQKVSDVITACSGNTMVSSWIDQEPKGGLQWYKIFVGQLSGDRVMVPLTRNMRAFSLPHAAYETLDVNFDRIDEGIVDHIYGY